MCLAVGQLLENTLGYYIYLNLWLPMYSICVVVVVANRVGLKPTRHTYVSMDGRGLHAESVFTAHLQQSDQAVIDNSQSLAMEQAPTGL